MKTPNHLGATGAALAAAVLLSGCAVPQPQASDDYCIQSRAQIDVSTGQARTVHTCRVWYFGNKEASHG